MCMSLDPFEVDGPRSKVLRAGARSKQAAERWMHVPQESPQRDDSLDMSSSGDLGRHHGAAARPSCRGTVQPQPNDPDPYVQGHELITVIWDEAQDGATLGIPLNHCYDRVCGGSYDAQRYLRL